MATKLVRKGEIVHVGWYPNYVYEDRDGVPTLVDLRHEVQMVVTVQDGPDAGREVRVVLDMEAVALHLDAVKEAQRVATKKRQAHDGPDRHEHVFRSPHSDEVCYATEHCTLTYGKHRSNSA